MSYICRSCALRAQLSASSTITKEIQRRAFTQTSTTHRHATGTIPSFGTSALPDLESTLSSLRESYFIPAYLNRRQRNLIYREKYKAELEYSNATATIGDEEITLKHVDRRRDLPARKPLVKKALALIAQSGEWKHVPALLTGLKADDASLETWQIENVIRRATEQGRFGVVLECLRNSEATGMSLADGDVLHWTLRSLRTVAEQNGGGQKSHEKAIKCADEIAMLMEAEGEKDRMVRVKMMDPVVIGAYLELAAVHALRYTDGKDVNGSVRKYAVRLVARLNEWQPDQEEISAIGPQTEFNSIFPVWHGLAVARRILGDQMPNDELAQAYEASLGARLKEMCRTLESSGPHKEDGYVARALAAYNAALNE